MTREEMLAMLNDPFVDDEMKEAMLRNLLLLGENNVIEDEFGNQILVDENGQPLLDADGKPIMLSAKMLDKAGINMYAERFLDDDDETTQFTKFLLDKHGDIKYDSPQAANFHNQQNRGAQVRWINKDQHNKLECRQLCITRLKIKKLISL